MTKQEFQNRISKDLTQAEYDIIEKVYAFHPSISNVNGKDQVEQLYNLLGMAIFYDMLPTAHRAMEIEYTITQLENKIADLKDDIKTQRAMLEKLK